MKALVYTAPRRVDLQEAPDPEPGTGDVLIEVEAVGICGSDVHAYLGHDERRRMTLQEVTFIGTYTYTANDFRETFEAIISGCLGSLDWTEIRALDQGQEAFADICAGRTAAPKIVLRP